MMYSIPERAKTVSGAEKAYAASVAAVAKADGV